MPYLSWTRRAFCQNWRERRGPSKTGLPKYIRAIVRVPRELMELEDAQRTIRYLAKHELQA